MGLQHSVEQQVVGVEKKKNILLVPRDSSHLGVRVTVYVTKSRWDSIDTINVYLPREV